MKRFTIPLIIILMLALSFSVATAQTNSPLATDTPTPVPTDTPEPTPTVALEPTLAPTVTPEPTPVPTVPGEPEPIPDPPAPEDRTVENLFSWIVLGGCGFLTFFAIEKLAGAWFHERTPEVKQYLASGLSGGFAVLAFVGLVALGVEDTPGDTLTWFDILLPVFFVGAGFANLSHAKFVLSGK